MQVETLAGQRDAARKQLAEARGEIDSLKGELGETRKALQAKELDVEFLTVSRKLAESPQALAEARASVRRLLRHVERAMALLKEDARL